MIGATDARSTRRMPSRPSVPCPRPPTPRRPRRPRPPARAPLRPGRWGSRCPRPRSGGGCRHRRRGAAASRQGRWPSSAGTQAATTATTMSNWAQLAAPPPPPASRLRRRICEGAQALCPTPLRLRRGTRSGGTRSGRPHAPPRLVPRLVGHRRGRAGTTGHGPPSRRTGPPRAAPCGDPPGSGRRPVVRLGASKAPTPHSHLRPPHRLPGTGRGRLCRHRWTSRARPPQGVPTRPSRPTALMRPPIAALRS
mmetsp:Transcript_24613/g.69988  ORF Transcript_24613/g.69988 Transcript_24613/m.69988 type:complete len:252 (-) Transcript_24613:267-1022(-)